MEQGLGTSFQATWLNLKPINHLGSQERVCLFGLWCLHPCVFMAKCPYRPIPPHLLHVTGCWLQKLIPRGLRTRMSTLVTLIVTIVHIIQCLYAKHCARHFMDIISLNAHNSRRKLLLLPLPTPDTIHPYLISKEHEVLRSSVVCQGSQ